MPNASSVPVLRVPRSDLENEFILLQGKPLNLSSTSPSNLDVKLLATEGENAYGVKLKHTRIQNYIQKTFNGTHEEFATILAALLFPHLMDDKDRPLLEGITLSAAVEDSTIMLAVRKSVGVIKQRIAAIDIPQTEDEIALFEWAGQMCFDRNKAEERLWAAQRKLDQQHVEIEKLLGQLNELAKLKQEHETMLLVKFEALLNSKKQHIRELTQLLEGGREAKPSLLDTKPEARKDQKNKGKSKNKARSKALMKEPSDDEENSSGIQRMDVDDYGKEDMERTDDDEQGEGSDVRSTEDKVEMETSSDENASDSLDLKSAKNMPDSGLKPKASAQYDGRKAKEPTPTSPRSSKRSFATTSNTSGAKLAVNSRATKRRKRVVPKIPHSRTLSTSPADAATTTNKSGPSNEDRVGFTDDTEDEDEL